MSDETERSVANPTGKELFAKNDQSQNQDGVIDSEGKIAKPTFAFNARDMRSIAGLRGELLREDIKQSFQATFTAYSVPLSSYLSIDNGRPASGVAAESHLKPDGSAARHERRDEYDEKLNLLAGNCFSVFFATNREHLGSGEFSGKRVTKVTFGRVGVSVPKAHNFGEVGSWYSKWIRRADDRFKISYTDILGGDDFYKKVEKLSNDARAIGKKSDALIFLHGYNTRFRDAAVHVGQIAHDLRVNGPVVFFSWPSLGWRLAYLRDGEQLKNTESIIADFLIEFTTKCGADRIHIMAYSMGNRGLIRALQRIYGDIGRRSFVKFNQIILAAPDEDRDFVVDNSNLYKVFGERTTLYASSSDIAVWVAELLHFAPRAGHFSPRTAAGGFDLIRVPKFGSDMLGHGYFSMDPAVLSDIFQLIRSGDGPFFRQRLRSIDTTEGKCWEIEK